MANGTQEVQVKIPENLQAGVYTNNMFVHHNKEEFVLDFMMVVPPAGAVTSRVICSPGHMKRIVYTLQENLKKYEQKYGVVKTAKDPPPKIGFQPPSTN